MFQSIFQRSEDFKKYLSIQNFLILSNFVVGRHPAVYNGRRIWMAFHKALKDLNLLDRFLFAEAMEDPVIMQMVLEIILGR